MNTKYIQNYFVKQINGCTFCMPVEKIGENLYYVRWHHAALGLLKQKCLILDKGIGLHIETIETENN
jgi:hypothetical protein